MMLGFSDGSNSNWVTPGQDGQPLNDDGWQNAWHFRRVDLAPHVGKTLVSVSVQADGNTQPGNWEIDFNEIVIASTDGSVRPIYVRQKSVSLSTSGTSGMSNLAYGVAHDASVGEAETPANTTTYYYSDHLGSSRLLASSFGYPVWQASYLPFGYEYNAQNTVNHYKFTGQERDAEIGLDHFLFRQYSSTQGRWLTPDPAGLAAVDPSNPQSWNRYAYVMNDPTGHIDPFGLTNVGSAQESEKLVDLLDSRVAVWRYARRDERQ